MEDNTSRASGKPSSPPPAPAVASFATVWLKKAYPSMSDARAELVADLIGFNVEAD